MRYPQFIAMIVLAQATIPNDVIAMPYVLSPPPVVKPCAPSPPSTTEKPICNDLPAMRKKYLLEEGEKNRGLIFFEFLQLFLKENGAKGSTYKFAPPKLIEYFGKPDYQRTTQISGKDVSQYAYLFNYKANKDWAVIVSFDGYDIIFVGYTKTVQILFDGWSEYE